MQYFTDATFIGGILATLFFALIILLQVIKGLSSAYTAKTKMNK